MADPAHRLRRLPQPRYVLVAVPRDALLSLAWWLAAALIGRVETWTGWRFLSVAQFAATAVAGVLAVLALILWRSHGRR